MNNIQYIRTLSHQLANRKFAEPKELVAWMGAIQAQDYGMSKWAIGVRLKSATIGDIETAINKGDILRTHVMRPTWHWVAAGDIRWMLQLSKDRIKTSYGSGDRQLGITEKLYSQCNDVIGKSLEDNNHLTRQELVGELTKAGITIGNIDRMVHFMMRAEIEGIVCSGVGKWNKHTYALLDERVSPVKTLSKEEALATLATKYFKSHSPANLQDFVWWSGMTVKDAKQAIALIQSELLSERFDDNHLFVHQSCGNIANDISTFHFLPAFDEYIIGYKDRTGVLTAEHQPKVFNKNGRFQPMIEQNGKIVGVWKKTATKNRIDIQSSFFEENSRDDDHIENAINRYIAFCTNDINGRKE